MGGVYRGRRESWRVRRRWDWVPGQGTWVGKSWANCSRQESHAGGWAGGTAGVVGLLGQGTRLEPEAGPWRGLTRLPGPLLDHCHVAMRLPITVDHCLRFSFPSNPTHGCAKSPNWLQSGMGQGCFENGSFLYPQFPLSPAL